VHLRSLALAIPAYNEADGIPEFLTELDASIAELTDEHWFVVVDDTSSDDTVAVLNALAPQLKGTLVVVENDVNLGHGPTVLKAYRRAIETGAEWILQVDGDGQFFGTDVATVAKKAAGGDTIVTGERSTRFDPWYRKVVTTTLPLALRVGFGVSRRDVNCPFRLYRADVLGPMLDQVPADSLTPHVLLTIIEERSGQPRSEVVVEHRPRRGDNEVGTTWRQGRNIIVPQRLVKFCANAARQLVDFRRARRHSTCGWSFQSRSSW